MRPSISESLRRDIATRSTRSMSYVLITPARNEASFIEQTIRSVVAQSVRPLKWVIVNDGSTDGTDEIIAKFASHHEWIEVVRMPDRIERHFAGKVHAFNAGFERVRDLPFDVIGSLDADISFSSDHFEFLLLKLQENPKLGLVGTPFTEGNTTYDFRFASTEHVSGACQLFRRECFNAIGGYVPVKGGGIDLIAVLSARKQGWQTRTFLERSCIHHRAQGSAMSRPMRARFLDGQKDYYLGTHPLWELMRSLYHFGKNPMGACMLFSGYLWGMIRRIKSPMSRELIQFRRQDQMKRLAHIICPRMFSKFSAGTNFPKGKPLGKTGHVNY